MNLNNKRPQNPSAFQFLQKNVSTLVYLFISIFFFLAAYDFYQGFILIGNPPSLASKRFVAFCVFSLIPLVVWGIGLKLSIHGLLPGKIKAGYENILRRIPHLIRVLFAILLIFLPTVLFLYSSFGNYAFIYWLRLFTLFSCGFLATLLLSFEDMNIQWLLKATGIILITSTVFVLGDWLTGVTDYPFSLFWSEGNRFWDYSIMFGMNRYLNPSGQTVVPFLEAGRQLLWALPFSIPSIGIWGMRLWNVILWVFPPLILGWAAVFRISSFRKEWVWQVGFGLWSFMFLSQGPIYPPLVLCAILVVIALRQRYSVLAILLIAVASYYARISRWTWMYAPGLWAGMLALLNIYRPSFKAGRWKEFIKPIVFGLSGLAGGELIPKIVEIFSSGMVADQGSIKIVLTDALNFRQPMLWDRLLPNPTYSPGILLGYLWVGGPIILLLVWLFVKRLWKPNWIQSAAVTLLLGIFSVIGFIVSVKIGGGSNLHNLDMLWLTVTLLAAWIFRDWLSQGLPGLRETKSVLAVFCIAIVFPVTLMITYGEPFGMPDDYFVTSSLQKLNVEVDESSKAGEVLFLDQRQLLTFGLVKNVPLVAEYEKKVLMNEALSGNKAYFDGFYEDLKNHRFTLIVSEPLRKSMADEDIRNFAEENNAWVYWVSKPLLQYYKPKVTFDEVGVQLLIPREN